MPPESAIDVPATTAQPAGLHAATGGKFSAWRQALRMARRDWLAGELYLLLFALVLAVAAL
ncbi:MAG: hypothetical protein HOQ33_07190, partial [Cupriavidus sp.]|nr:hypothetical protein [Cupriavidus sp.]